MGRLFWKFFLSILLAQLAATLGIGGAFWFKDRARNLQEPDIDTSPPALMVIEASAATLEFGGVDALRKMLESMERRRVFAVDEHGRELLGRLVKPAMLSEARAVLEQAGQRRVVRDIRTADGHRYLLFLPSAEHLRGFDGDGYRPFGALAGPDGPAFGTGARPSQRDGGGARAFEPGPGLGMPGDGFDAGQRRGPFAGPGFPLDPRYRAFIPMAAATLASLLFAALLAWYFSRPIRQLRLAFEAASNGDLAPRFSAAGNGGDELTDLGRDFDRMTDRLRKLIDGQTRLLHDVSHELRSPLARLQAAIGLAHQRPDKVQASLERIERESVRMDKLVGELLTLSRLEAGALNAIGEEISVAELVDAIVDDARFEAGGDGLQITLAGEADLVVTGQADLLARAIENVVRNAIKHSAEGGTIALQLSRDSDGRQLRLNVLDRGPGVAPDELTSIFLPFFRGNGSRQVAEGHGLGLAIARHVILAHRGAICARNRDGGGLDVEITLPARPRGA